MKNFGIIPLYAVFCSSIILPTVNMKTFYFISACFLGFLTTIYTAGPVNSGCFEKEKAIALLETAENLLTKAALSFPSCKEDVNSTDESECGRKRPLAYIEISKKLISDVRKKFPTCSKPVEKDIKIVNVEKPKDCSETLASGLNESGIYTIWMGESSTSGKPLQVYCDMETDNGGWTVIQRRGKFPVQQDFYKDWESYKNGFGNLSEEFWLGNENILVLCHKGCEIRFDLEDEEGEKGFALYQNFILSSDNYRINISDYTGNVGDAMEFHNDMVFSTKDKDNSKKTDTYMGGWWYRMDNAIFGNLNGIYQSGYGPNKVFWWKWRNISNLGSVEIKVRSK
ncbi:unnamed protein product [Larinioides sclopetarius]|uniref:Fibrinogen C-terminal domain-containing protein n=1 Tax=Larinioides sclopetarius TaxID=280406 RepID=A0AAV1ZGK0_9ARAC